VQITSEPDVAFRDCDAAFLVRACVFLRARLWSTADGQVGAMPRKDGMERKDLLAANVKIFKEQGKSLDSVAKKSVKVCLGLCLCLCVCV
jgi:hypothetical protein